MNILQARLCKLITSYVILVFKLLHYVHLVMKT